jgi:hypothetical protein
LCQTISFEYDANGNRISRKIVVEELQQAAANFQDVDLKTFKNSTSAKTSDLKDNKLTDQLYPEKDTATINEINQSVSEGKIRINIYPNPVKGMLKIDISNMPLKSANRMVLYDMSGSKIVERTNFEDYSEIDISLYKDGLYILIIQIDRDVSNWKIIKSSY